MEKVRVMIVDDSKISRTILANHLSKTNFEVVAMAADAAEALRLYQEHNPEIVTMDMNLPDADGIECSKKIRGFDPDAKIVMISAMKDASLVAQGRAAGISSFLQKPVSTNDIIETLLLLSQQRVNKVAVLRESYAKAFERALQQGILNLIGMQSKITMEVYIDGIAVIIGLTGYPVGRAVLHMSNEAMKKFAETMLGTEEVSDDEIHEAVEEAANIVIGRGVSNINDVFKDKEMRITPPGTIFGSGIKISSPKLTTFRLTASTEVGDIILNVGIVDAKLVNPFIDAFISVMPQIGFPIPKRTRAYVQNKVITNFGVSVMLGFTKQIRGNVVYNMNEDTAKFIASTMMMGMPVAEIDAMAQSAISEMSNMLAANTATNITALELEVDISTPSLTVGKGSQIKLSSGQFLTIEMDLGGHKVDIAIAVDREN